jgi:hypothetical protein
MQQIFETALEPTTLILLFSDTLDDEECVLSQQIFEQSVLRYLGIEPIISALLVMVRKQKLTMPVAILICHHYALVADMADRVKQYLYTKI